MNLGDRMIETEAIRKYGAEAQMVVAIEELSELTKELTKHLRGRENVHHISEEMADVYIMLDQLELIFNNSAEVKNWKRSKIVRLENRLHNNEK